MTSVPTSGEAFSRFMDKVQVTDDCWIWLASTNGRGYGRCQYEGKLEQAHRVSYILHKGPISKDKIVMHTCDNTLCVNPNHLQEGTQRDNVNDMINKGRESFADQRPLRGSKNGAAALKESEVIEIKQLLKDGYKQREIAEFFGVARQTITNINNGTRWGWL